METCLEDNDDDSLAVMQVKLGMKDQLNKRFPITEILLVSALLDPRFINLKCVQDALEEKSKTKAEFLAEVVKSEVQEVDVDRPTSSVTVNPENRGPGTSVLALAVKHSRVTDTTESVILQECQAYFSTVHANQVVDNDILHFWKDRRMQFPWLSTLGKKILCIPATSTPSERVFNVAGLIVSARRSGIHPSNVDKTIFIHDNYDICAELK